MKRARPPALFALKLAYQATRNALDTELAGSGLTATQFDVLKVLSLTQTASANGVDQRALQSAMGITSATLTRLLAGMERRGFVRRSIHPEDSRGKRVNATPRAQKLFAGLMANGEKAFTARVLRGFSRADILMLTQLLERIARNLKEA